MRIEEVIRSCTFEPVAEAAVASVGGQFESRVKAAASARGVSIGTYAVTSVTRFARRGDEGEMRAVATAMLRAPAPVLAAFEQIVTRDLGSARRSPPMPQYQP